MSIVSDRTQVGDGAVQQIKPVDNPMKAVRNVLQVRLSCTEKAEAWYRSTACK